MSTRRLIYGVGVNDAPYTTVIYEDISCDKGTNRHRKVVWKCPYYSRWTGVLERCYSEKFKEKQPTYKDCIICDEWLLFSNFRKWMVTQDWEGKHIDKDVLVEGNKEYSPDSCVFVTREVNNFITDRGKLRGRYLIGVNWKESNNKFQSRCKNPFTKKSKYLGLFEAELEAHLAWKKQKHIYACQLSDSEYVADERVAEALRVRYL